MYITYRWTDRLKNGQMGRQADPSISKKNYFARYNKLVRIIAVSYNIDAAAVLQSKSVYLMPYHHANRRSSTDNLLSPHDLDLPA